MLTDLHLHLDGSLTPDTARQLAIIEGIQLPNDLQQAMQVNDDCQDLLQYLSKFDFTTTLLQTAKSLQIAAYNAIRDVAAYGVKYAEIRFAPALHTRKQLDLDGAIESVVAGLYKAEKDFGVKSGAIIICMRNHEYATNIEVIRAANRFYGIGVVAVDLAGDEVNYNLESFKPLFGLADRLGMPITIHAGEAAGANNVLIAVEKLGAVRIGHGVRIKEDSRIMQMVIDRGIPLELCPSSNIQTKAVGSWMEYPIREYLEAGVKVTVNTDNPGVSNTNIEKEYQLLRDLVGLSEQEINQIKQNGVEVAFGL